MDRSARVGIHTSTMPGGSHEVLVFISESGFHFPNILTVTSFRFCGLSGPRLCRETPVSQTAIRLIAAMSGY